MEGPSRAEIEETIRYHHPEKQLASLPGGAGIRDEMLASLFGTDAGTYREIRASFNERASRCACELLGDEHFAALVDRLPFEPATTIVGLGDSITDDYQSWFEILRCLLAERRSDDEIRLVNAGISGDMSSRLLGRVLDVLEEGPAWILILIGTNDVAFIREPPTKPLVSPEETAKNLRALRALVEARSGARLAWMTPPPALEARLAGEDPRQPTWRDADLAKVARLVREAAGEDPLVDLRQAFGDPANPEFLLPDGLHPSLAGQKVIAAALVERLGGGDPGASLHGRS